MTAASVGIRVRTLRVIVVVAAATGLLMTGWGLAQARSQSSSPTTVQACVGPNGGVRLADECRSPESALLLATEGGLTDADARVDALQARVEDLEATNEELEGRVSALSGLLAGVTREEDAAGRDTLRFSGMNLQLVNDHEDEATDTANGLGNLIIGYNTPGEDSTRVGSHYLVVGDEHEWTQFGGIVAGLRNTANGPWTSVSGGLDNSASGDHASVSGGFENRATGYSASVSGGTDNAASGRYASVSGGVDNGAGGAGSSVSGGYDNAASGTQSSVSGGQWNHAIGGVSSISGGRDNTAEGGTTSILGGRDITVGEDHACHPECR